MAILLALAACGDSPEDAPEISKLAQTSVPGSTAPLPTSRSVTLITGDRVLVTRPGGTQTSEQVAPTHAAGREHVSFLVSKVNGHTRVIPSDAAVAVANGQLDPFLFDVTKLLELGYDDSRREVPVIVTYEDSLAFAATTGFRRSTPQRKLSSIRGLAAKYDVGGGASFWSEVTDGWGARSGSTKLKSGVRKVWLDGQARPTLEKSVPMIGAPIAWAAGYRGTGIKVAVTDSGIDGTHPDFAGKIVAAANFTDEEPLDYVGHGTHVASIIAGTGAAWEGHNVGVAPEAQLIDAKVCYRSGCLYSDMIAGMEWSVAQGAKIVNISLSGEDDPEIDPVEEAVESLTKQHGVLFVVAAGNDGPGAGTITSPGSTPAALTVGAVSRSDAVTDFSSRGPVFDGSIKPDITAPGEAIAAAFSSYAGGGPELRYVQHSGTSMATPHVAGAAALLLQKHPTWRASELKAALMASAIRRSGYTSFDQGAGRVNVAAAIAQNVFSEPPSLSLGFYEWPHGDDPILPRAVRYRNEGAAPVTLTLTFSMSASDGSAAPAGMFTTDATTVMVPAHASADVVVTANTRVPGPDGRYLGELVASTTSGPVARTPVTLEKEGPHYIITLRHLDRMGQLYGSYFDLVRSFAVDGNPPRDWAKYDPSGVTTLRLPQGQYSVASYLELGPGLEPILLAQPQLDVNADRTVDLDARLARPMNVRLPNPAARPAAAFVQFNSTSVLFGARLLAPPGRLPSSAHLGPEVPETTFVTEFGGAFAEPGADGRFFNSPYVYNVSWHERGHFVTGPARHVKPSQLATVKTRYAAQTSTVRYATQTATSLPIDPINALGAPVSTSFELPLRRTEYYLATSDRRWLFSYGEKSNPTDPEYDYYVSESKYTTFSPRTTYRAHWNFGPFAPAMPEGGWLLPFYAARLGDAVAFAIPQFADQGERIRVTTRTDTARSALYHGSTLIAESAAPGELEALVPSDASTYRFVVDTTRSFATDYSTKVTTTWTFVSQTEPELRVLPLIVLRFKPELDDHNRAPRGSFAMPLEIDRHPGAASSPIQTPVVEVSYDDGVTWTPASVTAVGRCWWVCVDHPPGAKFVSLRVHAEDRAGSAVDQTLVHAYGLQ